MWDPQNRYSPSRPAPSHIDLVGAEIEMINYPNRKACSKDTGTGKDEYDFIVVDCSPSLGLITVNALTAARQRGGAGANQNSSPSKDWANYSTPSRLARNRLNPSLKIGRHPDHVRQAPPLQPGSKQVRRHFDDIVFSSIIHPEYQFERSLSFGKPVILYDSRHSKER